MKYILLPFFFLSEVLGKEICFNVRLTTIDPSNLGCVQQDIPIFEYFLRGDVRGNAVGNIVVFEDSCYVSGVTCEIKYCVSLESQNDVDHFGFVVNQTRLRRNFGEPGDLDMWIFELVVNDVKLTSIESCGEQIENILRVGCFCSDESFGIASANSIPFFQPERFIMNFEDSKALTFIEMNAILFVSVFGAGMLVCALIALKRRTKKRRLSEVKTDAFKALDVVNAETGRNSLADKSLSKIQEYKFLDSALTLSGKTPPKNTTRRQLSEEDLRSVENFRKMVMSNKINRDSGSTTDFKASITFKDEQRMIKLQDVLIERMIFVCIESLQVSGPGATPRNTPFRKLSNNPNEFRSMPLGTFLENIRGAVNQFVEEEDDVGDSMGNKCLIIALVYLRRAKLKNSSLFLNDSNIRNLFFISIMVATKFMDDFMIPNRYWADFAEVDVKDINEMELSFCDYMEYDMFVTGRDINNIIDELELSFSARF